MSPRAWGCTDSDIEGYWDDMNVPTCVGVYRGSRIWARKLLKCPHVRGGVPLSVNDMSPPSINVPTCVGVYRGPHGRLILRR